MGKYFHSGGCRFSTTSKVDFVFTVFFTWSCLEEVVQGTNNKIDYILYQYDKIISLQSKRSCLMSNRSMLLNVLGRQKNIKNKTMRNGSKLLVDVHLLTKRMWLFENIDTSQNLPRPPTIWRCGGRGYHAFRQWWTVRSELSNKLPLLTKYAVSSSNLWVGLSYLFYFFLVV